MENTIRTRFIKKFIAMILGICFVAIPSGFPVFGGGKVRILTDMLGRKLEVPDPVNRVALLGGPTGQIAYILGARSQLCAVTKSLKVSPLVRIMDRSVEDLVAPRTTSGQINVEELIVADPQLVIAGDFDGSIVEKKTRIPVAFLKSNMNEDLEQLKEEIRFYGRAFQKEDRAEKYIRYLEKMVALVGSRTKNIPERERWTVFNGYSTNHLVTLGGDTFMHRQITLAGCRNATASLLTSGVRGGLHSGLAEVSMEKVLEWNPDILVIDSGAPSDLYQDPRWEKISAARNRRIYKQPVGVFIWDRPTAESAVLHPLWLAKTAYPELFKDVNLVEEIRRFYREIMSFDLDEAQAETVLAGGYALTFN